MLTAWLSGSSVAILAAFFSPLDLGWALMIAIGSTMGATWLLLPVAQRAATLPIVSQQRQQIEVQASLPWILGGILIGSIFVVIFGSGISL